MFVWIDTVFDCIAGKVWSLVFPTVSCHIYEECGCRVDEDHTFYYGMSSVLVQRDCVFAATTILSSLCPEL